MANDLVWDKRVLGAFKASACLTEEEETVLNDWAQKKSIVSTAMFYHMSERKVNRVRKALRQKYDNIQPYENLPKRNTRQ